jgi:endonuclease-3
MASHRPGKRGYRKSQEKQEKVRRRSLAEGIIADLHVIRVTPRIGLIPETKDGIKVEKQLMQVLPKEIWGEIGMAISFLGREVCRPTPKCPECPTREDCQYPLKTI